MPAVAFTIDDLTPFACIEPMKAQAMIDDAMATAALYAPCILEDTFVHAAAAKAIIRAAILRWNDVGSGAFTQELTGPFSATVDTRVARRGMFTGAELDDLKKLCASAPSGAFHVDTVFGFWAMHADVCSLVFGANYCSCGADIAGFPLWEIGPDEVAP
jgi:hypothetical protein